MIFGVLFVVITNGECDTNRQTACILPFFFLLLFVSIGSPARRNHIEVWRPSRGTALEVSGLAIEDVTLFSAWDGLRVSFGASNIVDIIPATDTSTPDMYDIYVNDVFSYACTFTTPKDAPGVLLYIIKDRNKVRIAPSPRSICSPAWTIGDGTSDVRPKHKASPLRVNVLRSMAFRQSSAATRSTIHTL